MPDDEATVDLRIKSETKIVTPAELNLPERYTFIESLGGGGMGTVIKAFDCQLENLVAIKVMNESLGESDQMQRFLREAKTLAQLDHANIVRIKSFEITPDGRPFQVMELLTGQTLADRLKQGSLKPPQFKEIFGQIIAGLKYAASKGVVHRDVKPSNIFLSAAGSVPVVKVLDFGIARLEQPDGEQARTLTATSVAVGSPLYMSPEQCRGGKVDFRSDIYSLGCIMYECVTGRPPFVGETPLETLYQHVTTPAPPIQTNHPILANLAGLVEQCLDKDPDKRPQSYDVLLDSLCQCLDKADEALSLTSLQDRIKPVVLTSELRKNLVPLACLVLAGSLAAVMFFLGKNQHGPKQVESTPAEKKIVQMQNHSQQLLSRMDNLPEGNARQDLTAQAINELIEIGDQQGHIGKVSEAMATFDGALKLTAQCSSPPAYRSIVLHHEGETLRQSKNKSDWLTAEKSLREAMAIADDQQDSYMQTECRVSLGLLCAAYGRLHEVRTIFEDCHKLLATRKSAFDKFVPKEARKYKSQRAMHALIEMRKLVTPKTLQDQLDLVHIYVWGARYLIAIKNPEDAAILLAWAKAILEDSKKSSSTQEWQKENADYLETSRLKDVALTHVNDPEPAEIFPMTGRF